jgi:nucleoside-diphosphate-sugar epimerase
MKIYEHPLYQEDIQNVSSLMLPWEKLQNSSLFISGATGLLGSFLVDVIMNKNFSEGLNCKIYALGRNENKAMARFAYCYHHPCFYFFTGDVNKPFKLPGVGKVGYVLHMASNTHPMAYVTDPIGTIMTNLYGLKNMMDFAVAHNAERFAFASSNEIYGENRGDVEKFDEKYCGYIDCNTMRAGYPESKRCGEALCQAYIKQVNLDVVILRLTRSYGATMLMSDTKAISQFLLKAIAGEDIVLKSQGTQYYSYTYVADAISGVLTILLKGKNGEAYNIADNASDIRLKGLAKLIANYCGRKVVFELPDEMEKSGYSTATKARLDSTKLQNLGWHSLYTIEEGIHRTIDILKD